MGSAGILVLSCHELQHGAPNNRGYGYLSSDDDTLGDAVVRCGGTVNRQREQRGGAAESVAIEAW